MRVSTRPAGGRRSPRITAPALVTALGFACVAMAASSCRREADTRAPAAREAYLHYCASCHGEHGRGDGPMAAEMTTRPTDLTTLASRRGGFDEAAVMGAIDGRRALAAHGPREMPVWGVVFHDSAEAADRRYAGYTSLLTTHALTEYIRSIQTGGDASR